MAATPSGLDASTLVQSGIDNFETEAGQLAGPALVVGAAIMAIGFGWRFAKRLVKG